MILRYDVDFLKTLKKTNVRIRKHFKQRIAIFSSNHNDPLLNNHALMHDWAGDRSIDITSDWRTIYTEKKEGNNTIAYFVAVGTHSQLYK